MRDLLLNGDGIMASTTVRMPKAMHIEFISRKPRMGKTGDEIITEAIALYMDLLNNPRFQKRLEAADGDVYDAVMDAVNK